MRRKRTEREDKNKEWRTADKSGLATIVGINLY